MRQEIINYYLGVLNESGVEYYQKGEQGHGDYVFHEEDLKKLIDFSIDKGMNWAYKIVYEDLKRHFRGGDN